MTSRPRSTLELVQPSPELRDAWLEAHHEWGPGLHEDGFGIGPADDVESADGFRAWLERLRHDPTSLWWIVDAGTVLGGIALRCAEDERVPRLGHVGYGVRPSARGRGVGAWALREVLAFAEEHGWGSVTAVCHDDNAGSIATLERVGGIIVARDDSGAVRLRRYAIPLGNPTVG